MSNDRRPQVRESPWPEPRRLAAGDSVSEVGRWLAALQAPSPPPGSRERVWGKVESELRRPLRTRRMIGFAAAGIAAAVAIVAVARGGAHRKEALSLVSLSVGEVQWAPPSGDWAPVRAGARLVGEAQLRTADGSRAVARLEDANVLLGEHTGIILRPANLAKPWRARTEIALRKGTVSVAAAPRATDHPLVVAANGYQIQVVGTVFAVRVEQDSLQVWVNEGAVLIRGATTELRLAAGESWSNLLGRSSEKMDPHDAELVRRLADARGDAALPTEATAHAPRNAGSAPAEPFDRPEQARSIRDNTARPAVAVRRSDSPRSKRGDRAVGAGAAPDGTDSAALAYETARRLAAEGQYAAAVKAYEVIAQRRSAGAERALYEMGRLRMRYLADPRGAVEAFDEYRTRFPRGTFTAEVELNRIEALLAIPSVAEAGEAIEQFLTVHPRSERRSELMILRGHLRRQRGDYGGALADYRRATEAGDATADDALYFSADCQRQLGDDDGARYTLSRYLERFPSGRHRAEVEAALDGAR